MKKFALAIAVVAALIVVPFAAQKDNTVTVGDFALKVSRALGYDARDQVSAASSLRSVGVDLGVDLNARVTERMASDILGSLGVKVTTTSPTTPISSAKVDSLVTSLALGAGKGIAPKDLPPPPTQCRMIFKKSKPGQIDQGKCKSCCKKALKQGQTDPKDKIKSIGKICDQFCKTGTFPTPSEPHF